MLASLTKSGKPSLIAMASKSHMHIINTGDGSLLHHIDELKVLIIKYGCDILAVTETWLSRLLSGQMTGYDFVRKDKPGEMEIASVFSFEQHVKELTRIASK